MAWKYRQRYPQDGEILNPDDWNLNHQEYADEFNGFLDRDNLPINAIDEQRTDDYALNRVHSDPKTNAFFTRADTVEWQKTDTIGQDLGVVELDCQVDCGLICSFGATWEVDNTATAMDLRFRITVDGVSIGETHFISGGWKYWSAQIEAATVVAPGKHIVRAELQVANLDTSVSAAQKYILSSNFADINERELIVRERRR